MSTQTFQIPPFSIEIDGVQCEILEVTKSQYPDGKPIYSASVRIHYKGLTSRTFPLICNDEKEMINKLKAEVTKMKLMDYSYGLEYLKKVMT
jgi:hypothetical protein